MKITIAIIALIAIVIFLIYSYIANRNNKIDEILTKLDVLFNKRHEVVTRLLHITDGLSDNLPDVCHEISDLHVKAMQHTAAAGEEHGDFSEKLLLEAKMHEGINSLIGVFKQYPHYRSDAKLQEALQDYQELKQEIMTTQHNYNLAMKDLKRSLRLLPKQITQKYIHPHHFPDAKKSI